jgi:Tfp pilus assembly protein FimV
MRRPRKFSGRAEKDSQRQEIYLKLLEIHAQHNKPSAFETVASELYAVSGGQGETWQKAMALGRQLDPSNPLFGEAGVAATSGVALASTDAPSDTEVFATPPEHKPEVSAPTNLDFTLDEEISLALSSGVADPKSPAAILAGAAHEVAKSNRSATEGGRASSTRPKPRSPAGRRQSPQALQD